MTAALLGTVVPMTILAYWLSLRVPKGLLWNVGIVVIIMLLSPVISFLASYAYESYMSSQAGTEISMNKVATGFALGFWMWLLAPAVVWWGRKRRSKDEAVSWKYQ